jgi:hypothetical protein
MQLFKKITTKNIKTPAEHLSLLEHFAEQVLHFYVILDRKSK